MPVTFRLPSERPLDQVGFAWSPLFEAVLSWAPLAQPKRTPMHLPWVRRCRDLPEDLSERIRAVSRSFMGGVPGVFEVGLSGHSPTFEDELHAFSQLDDDLIAFEFSVAAGGYCSFAADGLADPQIVRDAEYRSAVLEQARARSLESLELAHALFDDPAALRAEMVELLERFWEGAFREEWSRLLPRIEAEVTDGARALVTRGVPGLVSELLPEGRWDADATAVVVEKDYEADCDIAERGGLYFVPTVYGWPCVMIELGRAWRPAIFFPLRDLRQPEVPLTSDHEVADGLRALGDETRLQITRMVAEQPRSTKELAELLRLSDSAVSRHLKILDAAGIVSGQRDGYFVLYSLEGNRIGELGGALRRTLGLAHAGAMPALPVTVSGPPNL